MGFDHLWRWASVFSLPSRRTVETERELAQTAVVEAREAMSASERAWVDKLGIPPAAIQRHFGKSK